MVRGLYTAYTGMANEQKRLDIISNNIANAATTGYKKESVTNQAFDDVLAVKIKDKSENYNDNVVGKMSLGVKLGEEYTDYGQGNLRQTGNTYDFALEGKGFFQVAVKNSKGEESLKYTRDGAFQLAKDGYVVDADGNHLMSESGYLQIPTDASKISVDSMGNITADGQYVDTLKIADFKDYDYLKKSGNTMYETLDGATEIDGTATVRQGYLEQSNVQSVREMVDMINITRAYEANQKIITSIDSTLDKAVNSVGSVR